MMNDKLLLDEMSANYTHWDLEFQWIIKRHEDAVVNSIHYLISNHFRLKMIKSPYNKLNKLMSHCLLHMYQFIDALDLFLMMRYKLLKNFFFFVIT